MIVPANAMHVVKLHRDSRKEDYEAGKLAKRLRRKVGEAIADFRMIEEGDRVMVCLSGGKDSYGLLDVLLALREKAPVAFDLVAVNLDQKQPGFPAHVLPDYLARLGVPCRIVEQAVAVLAAREAHHDPVALFDHAEVGDRLAHLAAQALGKLVGLEILSTRVAMQLDDVHAAIKGRWSARRPPQGPGR